MLTAEPSDLARRGPIIIARALVVAAVFVVGVSAVRPPDLPTASYAAGSTGLRVLSLVAAGGLIAAGLFAGSALRRPLAAPLVLAGLLWTVPDWGGWTGASGWVTLLAQTAAVLLPPVAFASTVVVARASGLFWRWVVRTLVGVGVLAALTWDSFDETGCWRACRPALLPVPDVGHWLLLTVLVLSVTVAVALAFGALLDVALSGVARSDRRRHPIELVAALVGIPTVVGLAAQVFPPGAVVAPLDGPLRVWASWLAQLGALATAACVCWRRYQECAISMRLTRLVPDIQRVEAPARLEEELRSALGDPALTVAWWAESASTWVDSTGRMVSPAERAVGPPSGPREMTTVRRAGMPVAVVMHRPSLPLDQLLTSLRPAIVLCLENARLQAATTAELNAARATALRLVERSEAERRSLQRNLHDGAQQQLVGLAMAVRRIRTPAAVTAGVAEAPGLLRALDDADALVSQALAEVRRVAHDIHPALLADIGLGPALRELADTTADVVVRVADGLSGPRSLHRPDPAAETAAYEAAEQAVRDARRRHASRLEIRLRQGPGDLLSMLMLDDGTPVVDQPSSDERGRSFLNDQVEALAERLYVEHRPGALTTESQEAG